MSTEQNVTGVFSGDDLDLNVTVTDAADAALDLTSASSIIWRLSRHVGATADLTKSVGSGVTVTDPVNGLLTVTIDAADTASLVGNFYHELEIVNQANKKSTVLHGLFEIVQDAIP